MFLFCFFTYHLSYKDYYIQIYYNVNYFCRFFVYKTLYLTERLIQVDLYEKIKMLANEKKISIRQLEEALGFGNGVINRWRKNNPGVDKVQLVANYFDVSVDYLLGRTEKKKYYDLTEKDERDIQKELQALIDDLSNANGMAFSKKDSEMSEATREALIISLENALRIAKIEAKKKYTPKKYRD